jgi:hypothetical protein
MKVYMLAPLYQCFVHCAVYIMYTYLMYTTSRMFVVLPSSDAWLSCPKSLFFIIMRLVPMVGIETGNVSNTVH